MNLDKTGNDLRWCAEETNTPTGHCVGLREAADQNCALLHPWIRGDRPMLWALIDQTVVDLVADHQEILLHCNAREFGARCLIQRCAGRVRRISEEERLGATRCSINRG